MTDYYKVLEIEYGTDILSVKKAYRRLALKYHPDVSKDSDTNHKFIEITEAYEVLRDPLKKSEYDILYNIYFGSNKDYKEQEEQSTNNTNQHKQKEWTDDGIKKAKEYTEIPFEEFARTLLKEVSVGASYIPNAIAIMIVGGSALLIFLNLPTSSLEGIILGIIGITLLSYLAYRLFLVAKSDYIEDRKKKL